VRIEGNMSITSPITFVIAVNNKRIFEANFLASPCLRELQNYDILVQENFSSAANAYNDAIERANTDLLVFCHQDIVLPDNWPSDLQSALDELTILDPSWGVLGSYGKTQDGRGWGHVYSSGRDTIGAPFHQPVAVQTLDEIVLIIKKSSGLRFDNGLPHFHFYGADICLRAAKNGMKSYAISTFCVHNTHQALVLPKEFYACCRHIKQVWKDYLPIQTTCIRITKFNFPLYTRRLKELYLRYVRRKEYGGTRVQDPLSLVKQFVAKA
jgi:hypothetical protein